MKRVILVIESMNDLLNLLSILKKDKPITFDDFTKAVKAYKKAVVEEIVRESKSDKPEEGCCDDKKEA